MAALMLNVGILSSAHMHAGSYVAQLKALSDVRISGIWDDNAERRDKQAAAFGCPAFDSVEAVLETADAVVICSENVHHRWLTQKAAAAGKHVLCEKPLATDPDDARAMVDICESAGVQLMTAFPCRFSPSFQQVAAAVRAGELGEVLAVRGTNHGQCPYGWFVDKALSGGGAVIDHTVHVTDLLRALLGSEVESVFCEMDNQLLHGDFEDTGFLTLNFANGVFATLDASWSRPKSFTTWGDVTMGITGTAGVIELDMFAQESMLYSDKTGRVGAQGWGSSIDAGLIAAFVDAITNGKPVPITGIDGLRAVEVVEAAYESARSGQVAMVRHR